MRLVLHLDLAVITEPCEPTALYTRPVTLRRPCWDFSLFMPGDDLACRLGVLYQSGLQMLLYWHRPI